MKTIVQASLILVGLVTILNVIVLATGLHKNFVVGQTVFLAAAIALNIGVVFWALHREAAKNNYGMQVVTALGIGLIAGALIMLLSWVLTEFVFQNSIAELREGAVAWMDAANLPEDEYQRQLTAIESTTAWSQAVPGFFGTLFTSLVFGAVFAIFKRKKSKASDQTK